MLCLYIDLISSINKSTLYRIIFKVLIKLTLQTIKNTYNKNLQKQTKPTVLGGKRLTSMTNTYHDMEAVTSLLEEKERDLELAAHIGQTLLMKNKTVLEENEILEEKLEKAMEEVFSFMIFKYLFSTKNKFS